MDQTTMTAEQRRNLELAKADEQAAALDQAQRRAVLLNMEVRARDARIAELETELAALRRNAEPEGAEPSA